MGDNFKAYFIMIIFFTKTAELGKTKTRLKPYLNNEEILSISKRLIFNQLDEIKKTGLDYRIYYSGEKPMIMMRACMLNKKEMTWVRGWLRPFLGSLRIPTKSFDILKKLKISTIFVTHSMEEAAMYSDRIIIMQEGKILGIGKAKDLYQSPANKKVAEILYNDNVFDNYFLTKEDIEIYPGSKYHIDRKNVVNGEFRYEVGQYVVYSTSEYDLGDRVDIDIKWRRYYEKSSG